MGLGYLEPTCKSPLNQNKLSCFATIYHEWIYIYIFILFTVNTRVIKTRSADENITVMIAQVHDVGSAQHAPNTD